jgi:anti-sigma regulatory factor (Ser/Thr protein kinase)
MPSLNQTFQLPVTETSQVGEARRLCKSLAKQSGFNESRQNDWAIVVSEAAKNLIQHAAGGDILLQRLDDGGRPGLEMLALDQGPGIANVGQCLRDGYSTAGTAGIGLGAMRRLSDAFDIYSLPGSGTALLARFWRSAPPSTLPVFELSGVCVAKPGEQVSGDCWIVKREDKSAAILVADGLGHGLPAAEASEAAAREFLASSLPPELMLARMHQALSRTRGAAVGVAELSAGTDEFRFWGVGNIAGTVLAGPMHKSLVSVHGTVGRELPRLRSFVYPWSIDSLLIMHTDGLTSRWQCDAYPGLVRRDPGLIAGVLYRDYRRGRDDATVVVARARRRSTMS